MPHRLLSFVLLLLVPIAARAHVNSKDVFERVQAGPYQLFVTVRMPIVIPGIATVEVRVMPPVGKIGSIQIAPTLLTGEAARHPPVPDTLKPSPADPNVYTGAVWIMSVGAWQIHMNVSDPAGRYAAGIPIPAVATTTLHMQAGLGVTLALLGTFLVLSMAALIGAAVREARLQPGVVPDPSRRRRGLLATVAATAVLAVIVYLGGKWWNVEAANYAGEVFRPLATSATLSGNTLDLHVTGLAAPAEHRWLTRANNDFLPDHGHLMHLYAIRWPAMDAAFHLHPILAAPGDFRLTLPSMPPGSYKLYGDVVHANGFPETLLTSIDIPANLPPTPLDPEDASAFPPPLKPAALPHGPSTPAEQTLSGDLGPDYRLPDGFTMHWDRPALLTADTATLFRFTLLNRQGQPASDMQPYLGMAGHAAFVKTDGTVFAHTHPEGSAAMPDMMLANPNAMPDMLAPNGSNDPQVTGPIASAVEFPYGFPKPGLYRIFVQMKHAGTVETGVFDADVH